MLSENRFGLPDRGLGHDRLNPSVDRFGAGIVVDVTALVHRKGLSDIGSGSLEVAEPEPEFSFGLRPAFRALAKTTMSLHGAPPGTGVLVDVIDRVMFGPEADSDKAIGWAIGAFGYLKHN